MHFAFLAAALSALAYFTGYCYLNAYYQHFDISPLEFDLGVEFVFVHSFPAVATVVTRHPALTAAALVFLLILLLVLRLAGAIERLSSLPVFAVLLAVGFAAAYYLSGYSGKTNAERDVALLPALRITLRDEKAMTLPPKLQHIITTENTVFALARPLPPSSGFWVLRIPRDTIAASQEYMD